MSLSRTDCFLSFMTSIRDCPSHPVRLAPKTVPKAQRHIEDQPVGESFSSPQKTKLILTCHLVMTIASLELKPGFQPTNSLPPIWMHPRWGRWGSLPAPHAWPPQHPRSCQHCDPDSRSYSSECE